MFQNVCEKIVSSGIRSGSIESEKKDEYVYGMNMLFDTCINIISMVIIGIITHRLWECAVFCLVYKTIRKYSGGFHFESAWVCYISSCITYFLVVGIIIYIPFKLYETTAIVIISSIIIWGISPVEAIHKPLDETEKRVYKKRTRIIISAVTAAYIASLFLSVRLAYVIGIGIVLVMVFAIAGEVKNIAYNEQH